MHNNYVLFNSKVGKKKKKNSAVKKYTVIITLLKNSAYYNVKISVGYIICYIVHVNVNYYPNSLNY